MKNQFNRLMAFLERLDDAKIPYTMRHSRDDAIMVVAFAPGEYWEIEFIQDGDIDIERYRSDGKIHDESVLDQLFELWSDPREDAPASEPAPNKAMPPKKMIRELNAGGPVAKATRLSAQNLSTESNKGHR